MNVHEGGNVCVCVQRETEKGEREKNYIWWKFSFFDSLGFRVITNYFRMFM